MPTENLPRWFTGSAYFLGGSALSASAWAQGRSPFKTLAEKELGRSKLLNIAQNFGPGLSPRFSKLGEVFPTPRSR